MTLPRPLNPFFYKREAAARRVAQLRQRDGDQCRRCRRPLRFDLPAGHVAHDARRERVLAAHAERLGDHPVDVGANVEVLGVQRVVLALVDDDDRLGQWLHQLVLQDVGRLGLVHPAEVDVAHADAFGDLSRFRVVPRVGPDRTSDQEHQPADDRCDGLSPHRSSRKV